MLSSDDFDNNLLINKDNIKLNKNLHYRNMIY